MCQIYHNRSGFVDSVSKTFWCFFSGSQCIYLWTFVTYCRCPLTGGNYDSVCIEHHITCDGLNWLLNVHTVQQSYHILVSPLMIAYKFFVTKCTLICMCIRSYIWLSTEPFRQCAMNHICHAVKSSFTLWKLLHLNLHVDWQVITVFGGKFCLIKLGSLRNSAEKNSSSYCHYNHSPGAPVLCTEQSMKSRLTGFQQDQVTMFAK